MANVFLICGKICSGKSTYAKKLAKTHNAVILSVDEIMLAIFDHGAGEQHDLYVKRLQEYLYQKALELVTLDIDVILDFGFWTKQERLYAKKFFLTKNIAFEFHYLNISNEEWQRRLIKRNAEVSEKNKHSYFVDEGLKKKFEDLFEPPQKEEIHVWIEE